MEGVSRWALPLAVVASVMLLFKSCCKSRAYNLPISVALRNDWNEDCASHIFQ